MRRLACVLFLGCFLGCSNAPAPSSTAEAPASKASTVPANIVAQFERGEFSIAIDALDTLIAASPNDGELYAFRATAHQRLGHHREAVADLDHAIALNERDANLLNNRGFIRMGLGQFTEAMQDFDQALEVSPKYKNAFNNRGLLYIAQQQFPEAIEQFNHALGIDSRYTDAYNNRGFAEFEAGQIGAAIEDFNIALQLNPDYVNAYNNRGLLRARAGDYENAVADFTQAMLIDPLNYKYYEHRRDVYEKQGAFDRSQADEKKMAWIIEYHRLTTRIGGSTNPASDLTQRAKHFLRIEDLDKALTDLDRALELNPQSADALATRAGVHIQRKSTDAAKADAEASLAIAPNEDAYSVLGDVYLAAKDFDRAIEHFARARRIDSSVAEAYYARSRVLEKQGQTEQAQSNLDQALALDPDVENRLR
ncbi:tetratricopeptide repeat protein [Schlesneria paludicola]|uniref:tetratricopeptide repeat protein n=1 Tax=Schlesneria paludicola TaxID=360056 RepID=UPI000299D292|nr:tetratricopeptide repeat protein [Schlesneria paludicola]